MRENQRMTYDEEAVQTDLLTLSDDLLNEHYNDISRSTLLEDKIITQSRVNPEIIYPTVAGILLFSDLPDKFIPEAHIMCTRFAGNEGREIVQSEEIKGPLRKQINVSLKLILSWLKRDYYLVNAEMKSKTLVPEIALREVITNAVIHRKYWIHGATKIGVRY